MRAHLRSVRTSGRVAPAGLALAVVLGLLADASCSYSPSFANGLLQCGDQGQCPKGYSCGADNTCSKSSGGSSDPALDAFVGTWSFASGTESVSCSDGSSDSFALDATDFIVLDRGSGNNLLLRYFCDSGWTMTLGSNKSMASAPSNQNCPWSFTDSSNITTNYTWSNKSMTFSTLDGLAATTTGRISGPFTASNNATGTCDIMFNGALTKN